MFPKGTAIAVSPHDHSALVQQQIEAIRVSVRSIIMNGLPFVLIIAAAYLVYLYLCYLDLSFVEIGRNLAVLKDAGNPAVICKDLNPVQLVQARKRVVWRF